MEDYWEEESITLVQFVTDVIPKSDLVVLVYKCVLFMCFYILQIMYANVFQIIYYLG